MVDADFETLFGGVPPQRCRIIGSYIESKYPEFYNAIKELCIENLFWYGKDEGITFVIPTEKVRKDIQRNVENDRMKAAITIKTYTFVYPLPNAKALKQYKGELIDSRRNVHPAVEAGEGIKIDDGCMAIVKAGFTSSDPKICLWEATSGELKVPESLGPRNIQSNKQVKHTIKGGKFVVMGNKKSMQDLEKLPLEEMRRENLVNYILKASKGDRKKLLKSAVSFFNYLKAYYRTVYNDVMKEANMEFPIESMLAAILNKNITTYESLFGTSDYSQEPKNMGWQGMKAVVPHRSLELQLQKHLDVNKKLNKYGDKKSELRSITFDKNEVAHQLQSVYNRVNGESKLYTDFMMEQFNKHLSELPNTENISILAGIFAHTNSFKELDVVKKSELFHGGGSDTFDLEEFANSKFLMSYPSDNVTFNEVKKDKKSEHHLPATSDNEKDSSEDEWNIQIS